jgi:murein DD-endopeptidase MepM/ murein hydrolase activator NlpD
LKDPIRFVACLAFSILVLGVSSAAHAVSPADRFFFTIGLGLEPPMSWEPLCLRFSETEFCTLGDDVTCGSWFFIEQGSSESEISFTAEDDSDGQPVRLEGQVRIVGRGKTSSFGGTGRFVAGGRSVNFGLAGQASSRKKCLRLLRDFHNDRVSKNPSCMERADFGDPAESEYILPYPAGTGYRLSSGYCHLNHHPNSIAYDFAMPVGAEVVAARAGTVVMVWEDTPDEPDEIRPNGFYIEHDDGTVGSYAHITQDGVLVEVGDRVEQGQVIAIGGTSGTSLPHLHFMVYQSYPDRVEDDDVPVNFRNSRGPLDEHGGLMWGYRYRAVAD